MSLKIKNFLLIVFAGLFLLTAAVFAQDPRFQQDAKNKIEKSRRDRAALETTINASATAKALDEKFLITESEKEYQQVITDIIQSGDKSVIPYLKARLEVGFAADYARGAFIKVALFRLGEEEYFDETLKEIDSGNSTVRHTAVWKLIRFEDKRAYRKLYELLDDEVIREKSTAHDYIIPTMSDIVKNALAQTVGDPPKGTDRFSTSAWKKWFEDHPALLN